MLKLPAELDLVICDSGLRAFLVGGCVRDSLLNLPVKDYDVEVYGIGYAELVERLSLFGRADLVGKSFGVVKLRLPSGKIYDFSIPRLDSKVSAGHRGFAISLDPSVAPERAAARRDFTINALMYDPVEGRVIDYFGGLADLTNKVLRHTSPAFPEDPLRVLRGMQFAARFELVAAPDTVDLCRSIKESFRELARERVREEWLKWASLSKLPSAGLKFLRQTEWIEHFPQIEAMINVPQEPEWHPEGDVFIHTCHCCDALVKSPGWLAAGEKDRSVSLLGMLCHDMGKAVTTTTAQRGDRTRIVSPGHEIAGVEIAEQFLRDIDLPLDEISRILPLVRHHMVLYQELTDKSVRRLARRLEPATIVELCQVMEGDRMGRPPRLDPADPRIAELRRMAMDLKVESSAPKPILLGRHLIEQGWQPGPRFKSVLEMAYEAQLEGLFGDLAGALEWLRAKL